MGKFTRRLLFILPTIFILLFISLKYAMIYLILANLALLIIENKTYIQNLLKKL